MVQMPASLDAMVFYTSITFLIIICTALWKRFRHRLFPTALDNLPGPRPVSFWTGSLSQIQDSNGWEFHQAIADKYGGIIKTKGFLGANNLYVFDPKALHYILVKEQHIYEETEAFLEGNRMLIGEGIFTSTGEHHRMQRKILNPVFSIANMRLMLPMFYDATHRLQETFSQIAEGGPEEIDLMGWMSRLALELIGLGGLGFSFDSLTENSTPHPYGVASKQLNPLASKGVVSREIIVPIIANIGTARFRKFVVDVAPIKDIQGLKDIVNVMHNTSCEIFQNKKKALEGGDKAIANQIGQGKDVLSILMKANMEAPGNEKMSDEEVIGQITSLTFAATDTTSSALSRTFHVLALHKDAQQRIRQEIQDARRANGGEDLDYDTLVSLPYLDAVCRETLRLYPPVSFMQRKTREDTILPFSTPIKGVDGVDMLEIPVPKGTRVFVSIIGCNRNPEYWGPDSNEWKPERWLNPLPESIINARIPGIYSHTMSFLGGGRSCIGFKFSQLEMKVVLATLLEKFDFSVSDKEIVWKMHTIASPSADAKSLYSTLPLMVERIS